VEFTRLATLPPSVNLAYAVFTMSHAALSLTPKPRSTKRARLNSLTSLMGAVRLVLLGVLGLGLSPRLWGAFGGCGKMYEGQQDDGVKFVSVGVGGCVCGRKWSRWQRWSGRTGVGSMKR
jgi:hypothetical protein